MKIATITGDGIFENLSIRKVKTTGITLPTVNGEGIDLNKRTVEANMIPTTTAFIPSTALKMTTCFFKLFHMG